MHDPAGHYAVLGLAPAASAEAVSAAFRAAARRFHPDVPETGDVEAFIRARQAYDVLADPSRRAAYDRFAQQEVALEIDEDGFVPSPPEIRIPSEAWRRPIGLSLGLWAGAAAIAVAALIFGLGGLDDATRRPPPSGRLASPAAGPARNAAAPRPAAATQSAAIALATGIEGYILPELTDAALWRADRDGRYVPAGTIAPFTHVLVDRMDSVHGMAGFRTNDGRSGFVSAARIAPGDAAAAERAHCIYAAGPPPQNSEILMRRGSGGGRVSFENHRDQPAVVKLRDPTGAAVAAAFIGPRAKAEIDGLPSGAYRPDIAYGELWSHACGRFIAGMHAQRFVGYQRVEETPQGNVDYIIPPVEGIDLSDEDFQRD